MQEIGLAASASGSVHWQPEGAVSGLLLGLRLGLTGRLRRRLPMPWAGGWLVVETHCHVELKSHALLKHTSRGSLRDAAGSGRALQAPACTGSPATGCVVGGLQGSTCQIAGGQVV